VTEVSVRVSELRPQRIGRRQKVSNENQVVRAARVFVAGYLNMDSLKSTFGPTRRN